MSPEQLDLFDTSFYGKTAVPVVVKEKKDPVVQKQTMRILKASEAIRMSQEVEETTYLPSGLCQVWLPRNETKELFYETKNGRTSLSLQAGRLLQSDETWQQQPLPFGALPRLIMMYIANESKKKKSKEIDMGESVFEFLKLLKFDTNGRNYRKIRNQMNALATCRITLGMVNGQHITIQNTGIVTKFDTWLTNDEKQMVEWRAKVTLTPEFFELIQSSSVPLDMKAVLPIRHSPLRLDILTYFTERLCRVKQEKGFVVNWDELKKLFGQEYVEMKHFKQRFIPALKDVLAVYPKAKVKSVESGLLYLPSAPLVPFLPKKTTGS